MAINKVELCGVNTSRLPVLNAEEKETLLKKAREGDAAARERYIQGNLRLVLSVIKRFSNSSENADDLFQIGCIGLIKAIDNLDTTLNVRFSTYAVPMIIGEIRRYLRDNNAIRVSRSLRDTAYRAICARELYLKQNQKEPSIEEIAAEIGIGKEDIVYALDAIQSPMSLYEPVYTEGGDTHAIPEMSSNAAVALATLIYLFVIDWRMALASLITFPLGMVFFMLMMAGYEKNYARTVAATNTLNDTAVEYIGGIEVIKAFGKAKNSYEKFVIAAKECAQSYIDWMNKSNFYFTFAMNIMPATLLSVLPIGGLLLKNGTLTPEKFVLIVILSMGLITPIIGCMKFTDDLAKVGTIISQVTDILTAPELSRPETDTESPQGSTVELRDVHFGYNDAEVLHGIDLVFPEGTVNALVGPSGSGKSTIAKLIASFWDVGSGSITVGGADIRSISAEHYNKLVAYVSQDNFLFDNTVRENIRMGRPDATDAEVEQAARDCGCYDFIMSLENGFNTQVGSGGGHLSGGEKQRISIARAMLKNAPIVILDEATAYTDPENEAIIQESVARLVRGKTLIVIAHRLSTIVDADQIVVVNDGCIEATGTQAELLQACPLYETLWNAHIASRDSAEGGADRA